MATCLGLLYNALQFALVLVVCKALPVRSQHDLSIGKYVMDLLFLSLVGLIFRRRFLAFLNNIHSTLSSRGNAALLLLSLLLGIAAVLNFPHVHDSGQLMATNHMLHLGSDFLPAQRYGLGYSALCYFPTALLGNLPMGTLAAGYKIFILLLAGCAVIYGTERMALVHRVIGMFLLMVIISSSFFGLYGMMEVGKDSAWGVLLSVVFVFSLVRRSKGQKIGEPLIFLLGAMAAGMIAVPYLIIFCFIWILLRMLPERISADKKLLPAAVILLLGCGSLLMPLRLAQRVPPHMKAEWREFVAWPPTDGKTTFVQYFFSYNKFGYRNSTPIILAGLLGILLLPLDRERCRDAAIRGIALFLPAATLGALSLAFLARDFLPAWKGQKIPLTPLSTQRVWDLVKDIPQWYVQIICGILFVLLLDALVGRLPLSHARRRLIFLGISLVAAGACVSANFSMIASLRKPAHFYSYGGNKNEAFAMTMEILHRNPGVMHVFLDKNLREVDTNWFYFDILSYFSGKKVHVFQKMEWKKAPRRLPLGTSLLFASGLSAPRMRATSETRGILTIQRLRHFPESGGTIYLVTRTTHPLRAGRQRRSRIWTRSFIPAFSSSEG